MKEKIANIWDENYIIITFTIHDNTQIFETIFGLWLNPPEILCLIFFFVLFWNYIFVRSMLMAFLSSFFLPSSRQLIKYLYKLEVLFCNVHLTNNNPDCIISLISLFFLMNPSVLLIEFGWSVCLVCYNILFCGSGEINRQTQFNWYDTKIQQMNGRIFCCCPNFLPIGERTELYHRSLITKHRDVLFIWTVKAKFKSHGIDE